MQSRSFACVVLLTCLGALACEAEPDGPALDLEPRSLDGTELDGRFNFDARGDLVFDDDARQAFDYFLTAAGELSSAELDAWVAEQVRAKVGNGPAHARVMSAWQQYVGFRAAAADALVDPSAVEHPELVEQLLLTALDEQLGGTALAVSERERIERAFALRRAQDITDPTLRATELARLDGSSAQEFAGTRAGRYLAGREAIEQARRSGADAETITALRVQHFDAIEPGAAERLAALDARRADWTRRVTAFQTERDALREGFIGCSDELDAAIATLEAEHFSEPERRRVHAIDELADL